MKMLTLPAWPDMDSYADRNEDDCASTQRSRKKLMNMSNAMNGELALKNVHLRDAQTALLAACMERRLLAELATPLHTGHGTHVCL
jgi:hypothetical protein